MSKSRKTSIMTEEYIFIAQNTKGAIELQDGIYLPLKEVEELMQKYTEKYFDKPIDGGTSYNDL